LKEGGKAGLFCRFYNETDRLVGFT